MLRLNVRSSLCIFHSVKSNNQHTRTTNEFIIIQTSQEATSEFATAFSQFEHIEVYLG